jgi:hypothetical protein
MNRRSWIVLNLALAWAVVWAVVQLRDGWRAARAHQAAILNRRIAAPPLLPWQPLPSPPAVLPATYKEVAQRDLLDRSRDPNVPIEPPPPPPPPPPVPPLPVYHGYMNLAGPMAILSVTAKSEHQAVKPGGTIGEFTLRSVNTKEIEFAWRDQVIHKLVEELEDHTIPVQAAAERFAPPVPAVAPPPPPPPAAPGPGELTHFGVKLCNPGDSSPEGAVVDGFRKVLKPTPFGNSCYWEPVQ